MVRRQIRVEPSIRLPNYLPEAMKNTSFRRLFFREKTWRVALEVYKISAGWMIPIYQRTERNCAQTAPVHNDRSEIIWNPAQSPTFEGNWHPRADCEAVYNDATCAMKRHLSLKATDTFSSSYPKVCLCSNVDVDQAPQGSQLRVRCEEFRKVDIVKGCLVEKHRDQVDPDSTMSCVGLLIWRKDLRTCEICSEVRVKLPNPSRRTWM